MDKLQLAERYVGHYQYTVGLPRPSDLIETNFLNPVLYPEVTEFNQIEQTGSIPFVLPVDTFANYK